MDNITTAELLSDIISSDRFHFNETEIAALCKARYETMCKYSPIGEHNCSVKIHFMPQSEMQPVSVDTCLQVEIQDLIRNHGILTIGSCCGHGVKQPFIQVNDNSVKKMIDLSYEQLPLDQFGNGKNCFIPKTILYKED